MLRYLLTYGLVLLLMATSVWAGVQHTRTVLDPLRNPPCTFYSVTKFSVCGPFHRYLEKMGSMLLGDPISNVVQVVSEDDNRTYLMQYFEWGRLEYHESNPADSRVLLSRLGAYLYEARYPGAGGAFRRDPLKSTESLLFTETGKTLEGPFLDYWKSHGEVLTQGLPVSDQFEAPLQPKGPKRLVQYFERAIYVYDPDHNKHSNVNSLQVGRIYMALKTYNVAPCEPSASRFGSADPQVVDLGQTVRIRTLGFSRPEPAEITIYDPNGSRVLTISPEDAIWDDRNPVLGQYGSGVLSYTIGVNQPQGQYRAVISGAFTNRTAEVFFCAR